MCRCCKHGYENEDACSICFESKSWLYKNIHDLAFAFINSLLLAFNAYALFYIGWIGIK